MIDPDTPEILRQFLAYHETIKGQSPKTIDEYHLDLRMFLRFLVLMAHEMSIDTDLETISIRCVDVEFLRSVTTNDIFDFLSYLAPATGRTRTAPASVRRHARGSFRPSSRFSNT